MSSAMRDPDARDALAPPQRLEQRVAEAQRHQVLHRRLAEVVVDAERLRLVERRAHDAVDRLRAGEVVAERLLEHDAHARAVEPRERQLLADDGKEVRARREVHDDRVGGASRGLRRRGEPFAQSRVIRRLPTGRHAGSGAAARSARTRRPRAASHPRRRRTAGAATRGSRRRRAGRGRSRGCGRPRGSMPWRWAWNSAGMSLRHARSPVPPKRTRSKDMVAQRLFHGCSSAGDPLAKLRMRAQAQALHARHEQHRAEFLLVRAGELPAAFALDAAAGGRGRRPGRACTARRSRRRGGRAGATRASARCARAACRRSRSSHDQHAEEGDVQREAEEPLANVADVAFAASVIAYQGILIICMPMSAITVIPASQPISRRFSVASPLRSWPIP